MNTIGLYIGRFQPFHNGHKSIVDRMTGENKENVILVGASRKNEILQDNLKDLKNPFSLHTRLSFLGDIYKNTPGLYIYPLFDSSSDENWIKSILNIPSIEQADNIILYCGDRKNDTAIQVIQQYSNIFSPRKIEIREISRDILPISGTDVREYIKKRGGEELGKKIPQEVLSRIVQRKSSPT